MGIFTGIEVLFFWSGVISTLLVLGLVYLSKKYTFNWYSWVLSGLGAFLIIFTLLWSVSSVLEGEPQAANMGLLVFGTPVLILFGITQRLVRKDSGLVSEKKSK